MTATTLVLTHNWFGHAYLKAIMPFHRMIAKSLLSGPDAAIAGPPRRYATAAIEEGRPAT